MTESSRRPANWVVATVGDICPSMQYGYTASASNIQCGPRFLRITDIQEGAVNWGGVPYCEMPERDVEKYAVKDGDLLVARTGGTVGKSFLISNVPEPTVFASYLIRLSPGASVEPRYLYHFFQSGAYWRQIGLKKGGLLGNVNATTLASIEIPVCPKPEQQRIAFKIEELFSRLEEGGRALERVQNLVGRYRQSVLRAAVTGELTRDWREQRKDKLESGEALLQHILKARRDAWEKAELDRMKAKGNKPANDNWKQKYQEPSPPDTADLPELPLGWRWASLDMLADVVGGITVDQKRTTEDCESVPYMRVANVQRGFLDLSEVKTISAPKDRINQLALAAGDILFNEGGDLDKLGRGWIWEGQLPRCIHQNHVFRARLFRPGGWNKTISWYCNVMGRDLFMGMGKQTTNLASLSMSKLKSFPVPLMPSLEVEEIVSRVEDILSIVDKQINELSNLVKGSASLKGAVLRSAFSGQLVPQDPTDEPAFALLNRIPTEHGTVTTAKPKRGLKKTAV